MHILIALFLLALSGITFPAVDCKVPWYQTYYRRPTHLRYGLPISPACRGHLPCYDITLNYILDGPVNVVGVPHEGGEHFRHFQSYGLTSQQIVAAGRRAVAHYKSLYGVDLTHLPDGAFLSGERVIQEGVKFHPYVLDTKGRYRLYTASTKYNAQLFNTPFTEAGWSLTFTKEFHSRGTFNRVIRAGAISFFGSHVHFPCGSPSTRHYHQYYRCRNILNPQKPYEPIVIYFKKPEYVFQFSEPRKFFYIHAELESSLWGEGRERGMVIDRGNNRQYFDGRTALSFPAYL